MKRSMMLRKVARIPICGAILLGVSLAGIPAYADDTSDAINNISSLYQQYSGIFGAPAGGIQEGFDQNGNDYFIQWYANGMAIIAWSDGSMYFYNGGIPIAFGVVWKSSLIRATNMILAIYASNTSYYGTPTGNLMMGSDAVGTYYVLYFTNGTGILCASNGFVYYMNMGMWTSLGMSWKPKVFVVRSPLDML